MLTDGTLNFVAPGAPLSLVIGTGAGVRSGIVDLLGAGVGQPPGVIIGNRTLWGADLGIDMLKAQIACAVGVAFTTSNSATLNVQFTAAPDTGVGGGYQPGAWTVLMETGYMAASILTAGATIARFDWPPAVPVSFQPRFVSVFFQVLASTAFTAGTIAYCTPTMARDDYSAAYASKNFVVA